jgi:hypothetical protein
MNDFKLFDEELRKIDYKINLLQKERLDKIEKRGSQMPLTTIIERTLNQEGLITSLASDVKYDLKKVGTFKYRVLEGLGINLDKDNLVVFYDSIFLKRFRGNRVKSLYNKVYTKLEQKIEEHLDNLPF